MNKISFLLNYLIYFFTADNRHDIHSPFVFNFVNDILNDKSPYPVYQKIEALRHKLLKDETEIAVTDYGAGSELIERLQVQSTFVKRSIKNIAKNSAKPARYAQLLFRLAGYLQPKSMIELGTSLGISACYQAVAVPNTRLITCEGSEEIANCARRNFKELKIENAEVVTGNFDYTFREVLNRFETVDWIFFDGNHRKAPTLEYFSIALKKVNQNTVFIFDDINWSTEMKEAWQEIKQNPLVTVSIDIYMMGIVFFNKDLSRQHFVIRY